MQRHLTTIALSFAMAFAGAAHAAPDDKDKPDLRATYTKYEFRIPMRDGVRLFTAVYVPKDASKTYPFLIQRTPYSVGVYADGESRYGVDYYPKSFGLPQDFADSGYIFVKQDVRGRYMSEGKWQEMTPHVKASRQTGEGNESQDMHDTVDWLLKHVAQNNGKVGIYGISYPGFYTSASIIDSHPAIKAASPQAPVTDLFMGDDSYHGGAFMLAANFDFYSSFTEEPNPAPPVRSRTRFDYGVADSYDYFLKRMTMSGILGGLQPKQLAYLKPTIEHDTYDEFWKSRNIAPHLKNIKAAVLTVGGWFDAEDPQGPFTTYQSIRKQNQGIFNGLVIGPWTHGGWAGEEGKSLGHVRFDSKTSEYFNKKLLFPFFEQHLKDKKSEQPIAEVNAFETGTNVWRQYAAWPPQQARSRTLYFGPNGTLTWSQPAGAGAAFDEYVSDPRKPVPYIGYPATGVPREYMVSDQRFASSRPDVLVYQSEMLEEDVTIAGPVTPKLFVSTTGTDSDFVVKLIDVYPQELPSSGSGERAADTPPPSLKLAGYQQLVRGNPIRGKFRNSFEKPEPFTPGKVESVSYHLGEVNHTFRRGHRIMVQVQSSWFPLVDLNPQTFVNIPQAKPEDFQKATQRVYHAPATPSGLQVLVMPR